MKQSLISVLLSFSGIAIAILLGTHIAYQAYIIPQMRSEINAQTIQIKSLKEKLEDTPTCEAIITEEAPPTTETISDEEVDEDIISAQDARMSAEEDHEESSSKESYAS